MTQVRSFLSVILSLSFLLAPLSAHSTTFQSEPLEIAPPTTRPPEKQPNLEKLLTFIQSGEDTSLIFHFDPNVRVDNEAEIEAQWRSLSRDQILSHLLTEITASEKNGMVAPDLGLDGGLDVEALEAQYVDKNRILRKALVLKGLAKVNFAKNLAKRIFEKLAKLSETELQDFMIKKQNVLIKTAATFEKGHFLQYKPAYNRETGEVEPLYLPTSFRKKILTTLNSIMFASPRIFLNANRKRVHLMFVIAGGLDLGEILSRSIAKRFAPEKRERIEATLNKFGGFYFSLSVGAAVLWRKTESGRTLKTLEVFSEMEMKKRAITPVVVLEAGLGVGYQSEIVDVNKAETFLSQETYESWRLPFLMNVRENASAFSVSRSFNPLGLPLPNLLQSKGLRLFSRIGGAEILCRQALAH